MKRIVRTSRVESTAKLEHGDGTYVSDKIFQYLARGDFVVLIHAGLWQIWQSQISEEPILLCFGTMRPKLVSNFR